MSPGPTGFVASRHPITRPVFIGGTGRSGTTIVGELLGVHPEIELTCPREIRFLTDAEGLLDSVASGKWQPPPLVARGIGAARTRWARVRSKPAPDPTWPADHFVKLLAQRWLPRIKEADTHGRLLDVSADAVVPPFLTAFRRDRRDAALRLTAAIVDPMATRAGKRRWVDTTPPNARRSSELIRLYPDARVVNVIRDGRPVSFSMSQRKWGKRDPIASLQMWHDRMLAAHLALAGCPANRVLTIQLEDLATRRRDETYAQLLAFVGAEDDPQVRAWFEKSLTTDKSRPDLWRTALAPDDVARVERRYESVLADLVSRGVQVPA